MKQFIITVIEEDPNLFEASFIKGIKEGDVINYIKYNNIYNQKNAYSITEHKRKKPFYVSNKKYNKTLYLNNYGQLTNVQSDTSIREYYPLQEILDSICINTNMNTTFKCLWDGTTYEYTYRCLWRNRDNIITFGSTKNMKRFTLHFEKKIMMIMIIMIILI